ncbi:MAG TPA: VWA domain-containing protein, partial [Candidatus Eisenbacteria bacterium]|nr:VWA domain-containing protein [Candidatus Eisenbacteria bacterium]
MEWGLPSNFVWLWTVPAAAAVFFLSSWRKRREMRRFGETTLVGRLVASLSPRRRLLKRVFFVAGIFFVVLGLCQPHFRSKETLVERKGVDVLIAIDVSNSMLSKDILPNRLEKAKLELTGLVDKLRGDRLGVIAFAGEAFIQCPLTFDRSAVKLFLSTVNPNLVSLQGTSLSAAIEAALKAFPKEKGGKALVLLTDGEDHEG